MMIVHHSLRPGTYNEACFFLEQRLPITKVDNLGGNLFRFYVGREIVALYDDDTGELQVYRDLNRVNRCYGKLH